MSYMLDMANKKDRMVTLGYKHEEVISELKNSKPGGFNLSKFIRESLEKEFPEKF